MARTRHTNADLMSHIDEALQATHRFDRSMVPQGVVHRDPGVVERQGAWNRVRVFRSTVAPKGFDKTREGDQRSPSGVYRIKVTFSTGRHPPGLMPWKRRLPTSIVTNKSRRLYNTWIEEPGRTDGDRASMRWGFIVGYNHPRLRPGVGPKPVPGKGYGIFYHTSLDRQSRWTPTKGCTQLGRPAAMRWLVKWLDPAANPRVVQDL
jgi:L,D-peptidoglycan transpeptidase YkuD (ErfK/YbiS/YcfS/YnhG family)